MVVVVLVAQHTSSYIMHSITPHTSHTSHLAPHTCHTHLPGGLLKVTAGEEVGVGEEVAFAYGGGRLPSDRFLQDYGFLDPDEVRLLGVRERVNVRDEVMHICMYVCIE